MMRLAGTYHPIPYLLERIRHYLPGVNEINGIWMDYDKQLYTSNEPRALRNHLKVRCQEVRNTKELSDWSVDGHLFEKHSKLKRQLSLEDENTMNVLRLYFNSPVDGLKDVIAIVFPDNAFLKSLNIEFKGISTQEKRILSNLLFSVLSTEHQKVIDERGFLQRVEKINLKTERKIVQLKDDLKSTEQLYSSAVRNIINEFKLKYEKVLSKEFVFHPNIAHQLAKERLTLDQIENIVRNAIYLAYNLNISTQTVQISEDHIQIDKSQQFEVSESVNFKREDKVHILLDRYEAAAIKAIDKGLVLNGKNIASQLDPPVTPPAITDAVKKNNNKIAYLLQQYPEKWRHTRKSIKPIQTIDQERNFREVV